MGFVINPICLLHNSLYEEKGLGTWNGIFFKPKLNQILSKRLFFDKHEIIYVSQNLKKCRERQNSKHAFILTILYSVQYTVYSNYFFLWSFILKKYLNAQLPILILIYNVYLFKQLEKFAGLRCTFNAKLYILYETKILWRWRVQYMAEILFTWSFP